MSDICNIIRNKAGNWVVQSVALTPHNFRIPASILRLGYCLRGVLIFLSISERGFFVLFCFFITALPTQKKKNPGTCIDQPNSKLSWHHIQLWWIKQQMLSYYRIRVWGACGTYWLWDLYVKSKLFQIIRPVSCDWSSCPVILWIIRYHLNIRVEWSSFVKEPVVISVRRSRSWRQAPIIQELLP